MKVGELIRDTMWRPGPGCTGPNPRVSVLLPTFRRGADGTFLKAATSVLGQAEHDLELIIVDDASTDGTAEQIDELMRADGRVSCLRHPSNIGLPALSEYEAFLRARAPYLAFAFDDFIFEADALGRLLDAAERRHGAVVHGSVESFDVFGQYRLLGAHNTSWEHLAFENVLGNAGVIVPRSVVEHVGLYDPHIGVVRLCDWDLWRRILREYPIWREDVFVGRELGPSRPDSLVRTYPQYFEAVREYCGRDRNAGLRPGKLEDWDVWQMPPDASACLAEHVLMMRRFLRGKAWATGLDVRSASDATALLSPSGRCVVVATSLTASSALCFDGLLDRHQPQLLFVPPAVGDFQLQLLLARCDAVILVRALLHDQGRRVALLCQSMNVPLYYLIDDNLILLGQELPELAAYTRENVTSALEDFAGVLCTSEALAEYVRALDPAPAIDEIGPVFDATKLAKIRRLRADAHGPALRVGFVGGEFRRRDLDERVVPALAAVAAVTPVALFSRLPPANAERLPFTLTVIPFTEFFDDFLTAWGSVGLDVLVHPRGETCNIDYKTSSVLLSALYLGAVPIVASERAFQDLGETQGVLRVQDEQASWERAVRRAQDPERRRELLARLETFCRAHFAPERTVRVLDRILAASAPTDLLTWAWRVRQVRASQLDQVFRAQLAVEARAADVARLERASGLLEARVRQLEAEARAREARLAWLEGEVSTGAYALRLRLRQVARVVRRLASGRTRASSE